jgi:hypothetical protein
MAMADGYLFRVLAGRQTNAPRQYWYANIADQHAALAAVALAALAATGSLASVEVVSTVGPEVFDLLGIASGETRKD